MAGHQYSCGVSSIFSAVACRPGYPSSINRPMPSPSWQCRRDVRIVDMRNRGCCVSEIAEALKLDGRGGAKGHEANLWVDRANDRRSLIRLHGDDARTVRPSRKPCARPGRCPSGGC
jgi:hypothetical protein